MMIALVCDWYLPRLGGIERHLSQLAARLGAAGHRVTVITPIPGDAGTEQRVRIVRLGAARLPGIGLMWTPRGFRRLRQQVEQGGFDVVHVHNSILTPASYAAMYFAVRAGIGVVSTEHSIWGRFVPVARRLDRWFGWTRWPVVFSAVSERVAREMRPLLGAAPVHVLSNAVDPRAWHAAPRRECDAITIAAVMRLVRRKRGTALLRAFASVRPAAGRDVRLRIAGAGPERGRLERLARRLGVAAAVDFIGACGVAEVRSLLGDSDIFALPSRLESFGLAALEARAAGRPVIAMAESGVGEFIADGREGLLARDDTEFGAHLLRLCRDRPLRERIARHNRETPVLFTWERSLARHVAAYDAARRLVAASAVPAPRALPVRPRDPPLPVPTTRGGR